MLTGHAPTRRLELATHLIIGSAIAVFLVAAGQPIITDDLWWHLALGDAYLQQGLWLARDPLLFTSPGPPVPASWLADLALATIAKLGGLNALRVVHVLLVASILALVWSLLRRASGSRVLASLCTGAFIVLSAYRLIQLRPHLLTILFALLFYRLLLESDESPSRRRITAAVALCAVWPNLHAGFLLGPVMLMAGIIGIIVHGWLSARQFPSLEVRSPRVIGLGIALGLGSMATCINPAGFKPHIAYLIAGSETPSLARVADEWIGVAPFRLPQLGAHPTPMTWIVFWLLALGIAVAVMLAARRLSRAERGDPPKVEPVLIALSGLWLIASLSAERFLWLGIFPLLLLSSMLSSMLGSLLSSQSNASSARRDRTTLGSSAACALLLMIGFAKFGDWPGISRSIPPTLQQFTQPYLAERYRAHAVWMLDDAKLEGNLFNEYYMGGFVGYWLAPELRAFVNGSLNVSRVAMDANLPIREHRGALPGESFLELLDRQAIDIFIGVGVPRVSQGDRPWFHTTAHLENAPGWILVFRNITSAAYLRDQPRNFDNLDRVAAYYRERSVPFDSARGFDTARVIREARGWAIANGVVPAYYEQLITSSNDPGSEQRMSSLNLLALFYSAAGLYAEAIEIDRPLLELNPDSRAVRRRLVWCSLRVGKFDEALQLARYNPRRISADPLLDAAGRVAKIAIAGSEENREEVARRIARLPVFNLAEARSLRAGMARPAAREKSPH
ncbi:MAG: hypothetical protein JRG94_07910 [Deltaproteobacteria bacterium]|nr:hypothetical protein [Deltaproteobacteria bacterium]